MVSASRDGTVKVWKVCGKNGLSLLSEHSEHNGFVNAVSISSFNLSLNMDQSHEIIVASGGNDKIVNLFDPIQNIIFGALVGHEGNISQISRFDDGTIMTTSWDNTSRIWINNQCLHILKGHNQAVWGGCFVSKDHFLTGMLRLYNEISLLIRISIC